VLEGDLTVTRVEWSAGMEPNEAYHGPEYGESVIFSATREITLALSALRSSNAQINGWELSGLTTISREDFPQLLDALDQVDWRTSLVDDEKCQLPSTVGEDYHGATCKGTVIASVDQRTVPTGSASGEGYYGFIPAAEPDRRHGTIALDVNMTRMSLVSSFVRGSTTAAER
jgi:hypothetical protein